MRFSFDIDRNQNIHFQGSYFSWKPYVLRFLDSDVRVRVDTYPNYWRCVWLGLDVRLRWGSRAKRAVMLRRQT